MLKVANTITSSSPSPHTQARGHSASYRPLLATWSATRDAEHAVSTGKHGPVNPSVYEMRPEATAMEVDVPAYTFAAFFGVQVPISPPAVSDPEMPR